MESNTIQPPQPQPYPHPNPQAQSTRNVWIGVGISAGVTAMLIAVGMVLLGIPGALLLGVFTTLYGIATGTDPNNVLPPDAAWPFAILLTILWPLFITPSYFISFFLLRKLHISIRIFVFVFLLLAAALILPTVLFFTM
jgi:hypothetical protein